MASNQRFNDLLKRYLENDISREGYNEFLRHLQDEWDEEVLASGLKELWQNNTSPEQTLISIDWREKLNRLRTEAEQANALWVAKRRRRFFWAAAAAFAGIAIMTGYWFVDFSKRTSLAKEHQSYKLDKLPGGNNAILLMADGQSVVLSNDDSSFTAVQGDATLSKASGAISYKQRGGKAALCYNTLTTPRGGQFQVTLSDGTRIWLNAASSVKYPTAFAGNERRIEVTGEAYFEVAKNPEKPFVVKSNGADITVLGTHFNVNAYDDEPDLKATLLEGSIRVRNRNYSKTLTPGQQAQVQQHTEIKVFNVPVDEVVAWKIDLFQFEDADIKDIMRQLSRWYNVAVEYRGEIKKHFGGTISRKEKLSKVLHMLEQTGEVKFVMRGNTVVVMP